MIKRGVKWGAIFFLCVLLFGIALMYIWKDKIVVVDDILFFSIVGLVFGSMFGYAGPKFADLIKHTREHKNRE